MNGMLIGQHNTGCDRTAASMQSIVGSNDWIGSRHWDHRNSLQVVADQNSIVRS